VAKYSIDTSAILHGWRRHYPPEVFPSLWHNIERLIENGDLLASEEVFFELEKKDDEVYAWARKNCRMFVKTDERIQMVVKDILAKYKRLVDTRKNRSAADPFVIALASVEKCAVVTNELPGGTADRPGIPYVCTNSRIRCMNFLSLIREQGWVFKD
jgi:predicted nuclease of predicted toxin-antitoxin system